MARFTRIVLRRPGSMTETGAPNRLAPLHDGADCP